MGAAAAGGEEDEAVELAAAVRARFLGGMVGDVWGDNHEIGSDEKICAETTHALLQGYMLVCSVCTQDAQKTHAETNTPNR